MEDISRFVSRILDHIGHSQEVVLLRRSFWRDYTRLQNKLIGHDFGIHLIAAGSKAEGVTCCFESDIDFMLLDNDVICTDNVAPFQHLPSKTIFQIDMTNTVPGYSRLKLINFNGRKRLAIHESLFRTETGDIYASSTLFAAAINFQNRLSASEGITVLELSGPSSPCSQDGLLIDRVIAFPCVCSDVLRAFRTRERRHAWPPTDIIHDGSSMVCQLVPVGCKGSCEQWKEWRFCFIETELKLIFSLNHTQVKLYLLLKMVAKDILKQEGNAVSSYIMKNLLYWICERLAPDVFQEMNLVQLLLRALRFLKLSIEHNLLPYYMIPSRNLLAERLEPQTRRKLTGLISQLLAEGPRFLQRCHKLHRGMTSMLESPTLLVQYKNEKESIALLNFICMYIYSLKRKGLHDGQILAQLTKRRADIVFPEWRLYTSLGVDCCAIVENRCRNFLS